MRHARALLESRPFTERIPDQNLVSSDIGEVTDHVCATRDESGSYALIYIPSGKPVEINLNLLTADILSVGWYDPRTGTLRHLEEIPCCGIRAFAPPSMGPDWVLVLDDASKNYPAPAD